MCDFFVKLVVVAPPLFLWLLRISAALRTKGDPSLNGFLVRKELRNPRGEIGVVPAL